MGYVVGRAIYFSEAGEGERGLTLTDEANSAFLPIHDAGELDVLVVGMHLAASMAQLLTY
jgi:hypothetical protein